MLKKMMLFAALSVMGSAVSAVADDKPVLPKGFEKWEKSRQKMVTDKNSLFYGSHYIYVDKKTLPAYKAGKGYPEGSRFVVTYFKIKEEGGKPVEGKKNMVVLMEKNRKYKDTGGWLFAGFTPEGKPSGLDPVKNCFECHVKEANEREYVISRYADFK